MKAYRWVIGFWAISRILLVGIVYFSLMWFPADAGWDAYENNNLLNGWLRWDAGWYRNIADKGYISPELIKADQQRNTAFFPAYPLLTRWLSGIIGDTYIAGLLIANVSFMVALLFLYKMILDAHGVVIARRTAALILLHPFSFFFNAMYTESLFLLAVTLSFFFGERRKWFLAGLFVALAGCTRVLGVIVIPGLFVNHLEQISFRWRKFDPKILWVLIGLAGPLSYMIFLDIRYGNMFEFIAVQNDTDWRPDLWVLPGNLLEFLHLLIFITLLCLCFITWFKCTRGEAFWATLMSLASYSRWTSMGRLSIVIFPAYIAAAYLLKNKYLYYILLAGCGVLLVYLTFRFALWHWVA
ncbi:mannosyltransferase family protein [Thermodesulfobacteriota bacterium]